MVRSEGGWFMEENLYDYFKKYRSDIFGGVRNQEVCLGCRFDFVLERKMDREGDISFNFF